MAGRHGRCWGGLGGMDREVKDKVMEDGKVLRNGDEEEGKGMERERAGKVGELGRR